MSSSNICYTKSRVISYEQKLFIKRALRQLGFNPKTTGFLFFQKAIIFAYEHDLVFINLTEIYRYISQKTSHPIKTIQSSFIYTFNNLNTKKLSSNYESIFDIEFSFDFFCINNLISDFIDVLETI